MLISKPHITKSKKPKGKGQIHIQAVLQKTLWSWFLYKYIYIWFPAGSDCKESACNAADLGSNPGLGRVPGEGCGTPFQ